MRYFHRPCLRWPGNKYAFLKEIFELLPHDINNYHEPFLGAASVFFNINYSGTAYLSDRNEDLINFYRQVKNKLPSMIDILQMKKNTSEFYYAEREKTYNHKVERAAQLYYLNRTCFNGIYRVNSKGVFNVPFGKRTNFSVVDEDNLTRLKMKLRDVVLSTADFYSTIENVQKNDFIFLDPPYSSNIRNSNFLMYNDVLFSWADQVRLKEYCIELIKRKAKFIMTNLYHDDIYDLFSELKNIKCSELERFSRIGSQKHSRGLIKEYLFTNI